MDRKILELLYRSFDEKLPDRERRLLDEALAASPLLREEKDRIGSMRDTLARGAADSFDPFFVNRVNRKLDKLTETPDGDQLFLDSLYRFFRPVALVAASAAVILLTVNLWRSDDMTLAAALGMQETSIEGLLETPLETILEESL